MIYIGVDHGLKGALAAIDDNCKILKTLKMPLKKDGTINAFEIFSWLHLNFDDCDQDVTACGERLNAIFRASASTTFSFGKNYGVVTGILEAFEMEYKEVRAVDWQKFVFSKLNVPETHLTKKTPSGKLKQDTKARAMIAVKTIWGDEAEKYLKHDGICDALLIAYYSMEISK